MWLFPHQQAEKSLQNQHVLSILQVGSHQLQYRFFRTNKPKSHHKTNTFCPLTQKIAGTKRSRRLPVGVAGFEPTASSSRTKRATKLRHTPVPFEYSVSSPIIPNGDQASGISVSHAALGWLIGGSLLRNLCDANALATPGMRMRRRCVCVCGYAGYTCRSEASGRVAIRTFA